MCERQAPACDLMLVATDAAFLPAQQSQRTVRGMHQGAYARGCGAWLTSRTASARRLTCTCTPSGPPAARLQRRCSYRPHGPPGEASGFVATECVRNPVNSVNWGFLQACATDLAWCIRLCDQNRGARRIEGLSLFVLSASRCCVCARAVRGEGKRSRERDKHTRGAVRRTGSGPPASACACQD